MQIRVIMWNCQKKKKDVISQQIADDIREKNEKFNADRKLLSSIQQAWNVIVSK
jgi:uncharacterized protein with NAD-binding domain and iron-sulfur cluster